MDHRLLLLQYYYYYYYIDFHFQSKWKSKDCLVNPLLHRVTWTQWTQWKWKWSTEHTESIVLGVFVVVDVLVVVVLCCVINPWFDSFLIFSLFNMFYSEFFYSYIFIEYFFHPFLSVQLLYFHIWFCSCVQFTITHHHFESVSFERLNMMHWELQ